MRKKVWQLFIGLAIIFIACNNEETKSDSTQNESSISSPQNISYTVLNAFPHDTSSFTQGLEIYRGKLFESTGLYGKSSLREIELKSGKPKKIITNNKEIFAEGLTVLKDTIYQLSWENHLVFLYDAKTLSPIGTRAWNYQGWGITNDGNSLLISDGTDKIYFAEPHTLKVKNIMSVKDHIGPVNNLNELEMIDGFLYANRWQYDYILKIDPNSGHVVGMIDFTDFLPKNSKADLSYLSKNNSTAQINGAVLNGIAYDSTKKTILITGKLWPEIFEVKLQ
ncbi:MAG: glutaminyl-peptide cyclotransferase [Chitinophagaceae bacterium]